MIENFADRGVANQLQFNPQTRAGHFESYYVRANHPSRPLAFGIRYTVFCPKGHPEHTVGEVWAVYFDGEANRVTAVKEALPDEHCGFSPTEMRMRIGASMLTTTKLGGAANSKDHMLIWALKYKSGNSPLLLLPQSTYTTPFPRSKTLSPAPNALFDGLLQVDGEPVLVEGWMGNQSHQWGAEYSQRYLWAQVSGFDNIQQTFFEVMTVREKSGFFWLPPMTVMALRVGSQDIVLNANNQALLARSRYKNFVWEFSSRGKDIAVHGKIESIPANFAGLKYLNPAGGSKICLNTGVARCEVTLEQKGKPAIKLLTENKALFEVLADRNGHGIPILA